MVLSYVLNTQFPINVLKCLLIIYQYQDECWLPDFSVPQPEGCRPDQLKTCRVSQFFQHYLYLLYIYIFFLFFTYFGQWLHDFGAIYCPKYDCSHMDTPTFTSLKSPSSSAPSTPSPVVTSPPPPPPPPPASTSLSASIGDQSVEDECEQICVCKPVSNELAMDIPHLAFFDRFRWFKRVSFLCLQTERSERFFRRPKIDIDLDE